MAKKNNARILKIILAFVAVAILAIFSAGGFYMLTGHRLNAVEGDVENIKKDDLPKIDNALDEHEGKLYEHWIEVYGVKKELGYLGEKVDRNFEEQKEFQTEQKQLSQKILDEIRKR